MSDLSRFHRLSNELFPVLVQYIPVVDRVHGDHHPEFHEVRRLFDSVYQKTQASNVEKPELREEFSQLQEISRNYAVPDDVCETYEDVYVMLRQLSVAYQG